MPSDCATPQTQLPLRRGAERAEITVEQVLRELAKIGFSDIRKVVTWRNEVVAERVFEEGEKAEKGGNCGEGVKALMPRVTLVPAEEIDEATASAIAQISQGVSSRVNWAQSGLNSCASLCPVQRVWPCW